MNDPELAETHALNHSHRASPGFARMSLHIWGVFATREIIRQCLASWSEHRRVDPRLGFLFFHAPSKGPNSYLIPASIYNPD